MRCASPSAPCHPPLPAGTQAVVLRGAQQPPRQRLLDCQQTLHLDAHIYEISTVTCRGRCVVAVAPAPPAPLTGPLKLQCPIAKAIFYERKEECHAGVA